jgi:flagellar hook-length control protein FliK
MRITNELAPVARPADTKTPETAAGETFAALLAVAGLAVAANAAPTDCPVTDAGTSGPTTMGTVGEHAAGAPAEALLALGLLGPTIAGTGLPAGATATTAPATGVAPAPLPTTADPAVTGTAGATAATAADAFDMDRLDITVEIGAAADADGTPGVDRRPGAESRPTVVLPEASPATDTATATATVLDADAPATGRPAAAPGAVESTDALDATGPATNATGPVHGSRTTIPSVAATDHPIPPSRLSDVALAAARTSSEADRPVRLTVRLDPPNLGEVRVELVARNGSVTVRVEPVHDAAAPLLAHQRDAVAAALERTGMSLSSFDVTPGEPERRQAPQSKRTVRIAELTATDGTSTDEPTAGRTGLRI